jgi:drug/metabolite transporter (DMT)-like permease
MKSGLFFAVLASFLFACMNASAKFLAASMSVPEIVFYRGVLGTVLTMALVARSGSGIKVKNWPLLISRGLFGAGSLLLAFFAISKIDLAEASFLAHLSPLITVFLAARVLGEKVPRGSYPVFLVVACGALLVAAPWKLSLHVLYALLGILGAVLASSASVAIRSLSKDHDNYTIMLGFLGVAALLPVPFIEWSKFSVPTGLNAVATLFLGSVSFLAQYCLTQAYRLEKAGLVATTRYVGIVFNIGFGYAIWKEVPPSTSLLGGILIVVGCLVLPRLK